MKLKFNILLIFLIFFNCKSTNVQKSNCPVFRHQLKRIIKKNIDSERFGSNPLIIKNGVIYKRFKEIDSIELDSTYIKHSLIKNIKKNSAFIVSVIGDKAKDGICLVDTKERVKSKVKTKLILLVNGEVVNKKSFRKFQKKNETQLEYFIPNLLINNSKVDIINIKNRVANKEVYSFKRN